MSQVAPTTPPQRRLIYDVKAGTVLVDGTEASAPPVAEGGVATVATGAAPGGRVLTGTFTKHLKARGKVTLRESPTAPTPPTRRPAQVASMLALAHHLQAAIDCGRLADQSSAARALGLTPARVTQILNLLLLAPIIQEELLHLEAVDGQNPLPERALREVIRAGVVWRDQILAWHRVRAQMRRPVVLSARQRG